MRSRTCRPARTRAKRGTRSAARRRSRSRSARRSPSRSPSRSRPEPDFLGGMNAEKTKDTDTDETRSAGILRVATRGVAFGVFLLLVAGALVTSPESGLAVPDWPLSYGKVMPPMVGGILYEHGHRLVAAAVSTLVGLELGALLFFLKGRKTVKLLAATAFVAILLQAVLGGLTVLFLLPPAISSAHAALAEIVFALTAVVALMCSKTWTELTARPLSLSLEENPNISSKGVEAMRAFRWVILATAAIYVQIVLGAVMRHTGAGLAIPDFPAAFGGEPRFRRIRRGLDRPRRDPDSARRPFHLVEEGAVPHGRPPRRGRPLLGHGRPRHGLGRRLPESLERGKLPHARMSLSRIPSTFASYVSLTKPRITVFVVMTAFVGFVAGTNGPLSS